jgi:D-alanine transaminase
MTLCCLNGVIGPLDEARISPMDRGFLFGDGVYEVLAHVDGVTRARQLHRARLALSRLTRFSQMWIGCLRPVH